MKLATKLPSTIAKKAMKKPTEIATKTRQALDKKKNQPQDFILEYGGQDPMIEWLAENFDPHAKLIIDSTSAELLGGSCAFRTDNYIKD